MAVNKAPSGNDNPSDRQKIKQINYKLKQNRTLMKGFRREERFFCNPNNHIYDKESCTIIWKHIEELERRHERIKYDKLLVEYLAEE